MPPLNHAVLSASSAYRWLECPPSALATADIPDETTIYAQEGSAAHEMAEYKIRWHLSLYASARWTPATLKLSAQLTQAAYAGSYYGFGTDCGSRAPSR